MDTAAAPEPHEVENGVEKGEEDGGFGVEATVAAPEPLDLVGAVRKGEAPSGAVLSTGLIRVLRNALDTVRVAVRRYGVSAIATAFNGGKDATVVLHLTRAAIAAEGGGKLMCMYLIEENAFPEVDQFVRETVKKFDLASVEQAGGFKEGIREFVEQKGVQAFVMGTRRSDPDAAGMVVFMPSSPGWPPFMRVNPILDWGYDHVWEFLRAFELPYCDLYDRGYTSIGNVHNTDPNPALGVVANGEATNVEEPRRTFRPAWELTNPNLERAGRIGTPRQIKQARIE